MSNVGSSPYPAPAISKTLLKNDACCVSPLEAGVFFLRRPCSPRHSLHCLVCEPVKLNRTAVATYGGCVPPQPQKIYSNTNIIAPLARGFPNLGR